MPTKLQAVFLVSKETIAAKSTSSSPQTCTASIIIDNLKMRGSPDQLTWLLPKTGTVVGRRHLAAATHAFQALPASGANSPKRVSTRVVVQGGNSGQTAESLTDPTSIGTPGMSSTQRQQNPAAATCSGQERLPRVTRSPTRIFTRVGFRVIFWVKLPIQFIQGCTQPAI